MVQAKAVASRKEHPPRQFLWRPRLCPRDASPLHQRFCPRRPNNQAPERSRADFVGEPLELRRSAGRKTCGAQSAQKWGDQTVGHVCLSGGSTLAYFFALAFGAASAKSLETSRFRDASIFADLRSPRATRLTYEGSTPNLSATRL